MVTAMSERGPSFGRRLPLTTMVIVAALLLTACGEAATVPAAADHGLGLLVVPEPDRPAAPEISGRTLDGDDVTLSDLHGRIVILNAFASWCAPCQEELPELVRAWRERPDVAFVGLDVNDSAEAAKGFLAAEGAGYPVISDAQGTLLAMFTASPNRGLPVTFLIDREGRVAGRILGRATRPALDSAMRALS